MKPSWCESEHRYGVARVSLTEQEVHASNGTHSNLEASASHPEEVTTLPKHLDGGVGVPLTAVTAGEVRIIPTYIEY